MFIGRKEELKQLESVYASDHSNMLVIYGREGMGKTALALKFSENRDYIYHRCCEVGPEEQLRRFELAMKGSQAIEAKRVLIIDEFQFAVSPAFNERILAIASNEAVYGRVMILLLSSSVSWVENSMVSSGRELARAITGIIKLKELSFAETVEWFSKSSASDCVVIRSMLGGVPKYLNYWQENRRVRENVISLFLTNDAPLINEAERLLKLELRELGAYNTILTALAKGLNKLNDIYAFTGFSRAKISVYIKNLSEMDLVEKIYSVSVKNPENTQKGLYRIKDNFLNFYYAYVFPNLSEIECGQGKSLFNNVLVPDFDRFMRKSFSDVCREYLELMSKYKRLGKYYNEWHYWFGKKGIIDIIGLDADRNMIAAICHYSDVKSDVEQLEELKSLVEEAGIRPSRLCIFSKTGFESELLRDCRNEGVMTVALSDL